MPISERASILAELNPPFRIIAPVRQTAPFVFCSPHSGSIYPEVLLRSSKLDPLALRKSEDAFVDELFGCVAGLGAPLIAARFPRAYLDANREPYELDPELFGTRLPPHANSQSMRVAGGLGTIARIVADGEEIYAADQRPSLEAGIERIELLYKPFHAALNQLIQQTRSMFGFAILIDCHSMPSSSMVRPGGNRPDIVLGDRFGASCDPKVVRLVRETIAGIGLQVQLNRPYAGGFITEHYGRPYEGVHALQIEINRALYLDEVALVPSIGFEALKTGISLLAARLFRDLPRVLASRAAAE